MALAAPLATAAQPQAAPEPTPATPATSTTPATPTAPVAPAPLRTSADAVPGEYIVTLDKGVDAAELARKLGLKPKHVYTSVLNGFAAPLTGLQLEGVRKSLGVKAVEEDTRVASAPAPSTAPKAPSSSWGLDRVDQRQLPLNDDFTVNGNGAGVTAYILDTGIDYTHPEFGGRASAGFDAMPDAGVQRGRDCNGHGTHVAGTVAGATYGVARKANLVSVRVLGCDGKGSYAGMIAGMDWVAKNARQPAVLNGSLGGPRSEVLNKAADAVSDAGVLPVIAAGNEAQDACNVSPASAARVITVAASDRWDRETSFSNYGPCVSLYAPGQDIVSARLGGGSIAENGTSMAAPHVTGLAALYKQAHPNELPEDVASFLLEESTKDVLTSLSKGTPNRLLFTAGL
ncbi:S8 family peptidase [Streptomyces sp. NPDC035033]|uniref:S8 family peptidase n=1 Tax=Streptomyces sp. NPDC035033 TaxID=3155368 RepID=UPI0033CF3A09